MAKKFWKHIDKIFLGSITTLVLLIVNILCWIFSADFMIPMWLYIITMLVMYICCIVVYAVASSKKESIVYRLPTVMSIYKDPQNLIFIVEKNELFNINSYVTICYQSQDELLETVLALGVVDSTTSEGYLQITIEKMIQNEKVEKVLKSLKDTKAYRDSIKIKPGIHRDLLKED